MPNAKMEVSMRVCYKIWKVKFALFILRWALWAANTLLGKGVKVKLGNKVVTRIPLAISMTIAVDEDFEEMD